MAVTTTMTAAVLAGLAVWTWASARSPADRFLSMTREPGTAEEPAGTSARTLGAWPVLAVSVGLAGFLVVGGLAGLAVGGLSACCVLVVAVRREPVELRRRREWMAEDLPFAADLMVACLRAGRPLSSAVETTAEAVGGPLGERLAWVGAQMRLGADPETAWATLAAEPPLAALARAMSRAARSGAPVADVLLRLADDARRAARAASSAAARRAGVQVVAPLGLCFLPAFVFLGIVPVVAGLAVQILLP